MGFDHSIEKELHRSARNPVVVILLARLFDSRQLRARYLGRIHSIRNVEAHRQVATATKLVEQFDLADVTFSWINASHDVHSSDAEFVSVLQTRAKRPKFFIP